MTVCRTIKKIENVLIKSKQFHLLGKKALQPSDAVIEIVLIDATEQPVERPHLPWRAVPGKKDNAGITAAKEPSHKKAQLVADFNTEKILATDFCIDSEHDFQLFKNSRCTISPETCLLADSGYQELLALHPNSQTPVKKSKLHPLSQEQKASNRKLSRKRILIENLSHFECTLPQPP